MTAPGVSERALLREAAQWHALLCSGEAGAAEQAAWQAWHDARAEHRWAWQRVEQLRQCLQGVPGPLVAQTLHLAGDRAGKERRAVLKGLALLVAGGGALALGARTEPWRALTAGYRTGTGERRDVRLADGSLLQLNTDTAADVLFGADERLVRLHRGEIMITTAADTAGRPFRVEVAEGRVQPLGTRFLVRRDAPGSTLVAVQESAVAISPRAAQRGPVLLQAGWQARFDALGVAPQIMADDSLVAWRDGMLVVSDWRLDDFLAELGRYRPGWLSCDERVAGFRVSGAFPLDDTDRALAALTESFPVSLRARTRYWVRVEPAAGV